ncbi:MAG: hypothetical protein Q8K63_06145, partial [Acidimicrobiales bacterium]|nr:hypothetical protein [Acidimicrobiales bacterium]
VLAWLRARLIWGMLNDPKAALDDLTYASNFSPSWLRDVAASELEECVTDAAASRKRKPSVNAAPEYDPTPVTVAPPNDRITPGTKPTLWADVLAFLPLIQ